MKLVSAAALLLAGLLSAAFAQNGKANEQGQTPPKEEVKCVSSNTSFQRKGNGVVLQVELTNVCEKRQRCTINAYTISAFGAKAGREEGDACSEIEGCEVKGRAGDQGAAGRRRLGQQL